MYRDALSYFFVRPSEPGGGLLVAHERDVRMALQHARGNGFRHLALHHLVHGVRLVFAVGDDDDALRVHDIGDAHRDRPRRHFADVRKQARIVADGALGQAHDMREGVESGARLVEPDMPVGADAQHLHVLFHPFEQGVVAAALRVEVGGGAVGQVGVRGVDIDMAEQVFAHEVVVALHMIRFQPDVFVEIDAAHPLEGKFAALIRRGQFSVQPDGAGTGGEPEHARGVIEDDRAHEFVRLFAHFVVIFRDDDLHIQTSLYIFYFL